MRTREDISGEFEYGSWAIRVGTTGWIVETWSRVTGCRTGAKWIVHYWPACPKGADLDTEINEHGITLAYLILERDADKVLRRGIEVE